MDNYHYIIAGLPDLVPDFESQNFSYAKLEEQIVPQLSDKDKRLVDWLEFGFDNDKLSGHFYREAAKSHNLFVSRYFIFERQIRNCQVQYLSKRLEKDGEQFIVGSFDDQFEEYKKVQAIFEMEDMMEREKALDKLRWEKISEIVTFQYFNINVILAFLSKAKIVKRWNDLDKEEGAKLFKQLVQEVRGTFKGIQ